MMRTRWLGGMVAFIGLCWAAAPVVGASFQLVSALAPEQNPPAGGNGDSSAPVISANGRYVLFASTADDMAWNLSHKPYTNRFPARLNVFLRDRTVGLTTLVSLNSQGTSGGNGDSLPLAISTNGQWALFESSATDLVGKDTNNAADVFVRNLTQGTTTLVSVGTNGWAGRGASHAGGMTPDGRYVAFTSAADDLVPGDTNRLVDVFVRDLKLGVTTLVSVGAASGSASAGSAAPELTPDGRYVVFWSTATNLVSGVLTTNDIYVRDLVEGRTCWASAGARDALLAVLRQSQGACFNHAISADGRFVAYQVTVGPASTTVYPSVTLRYQLANGLTELVHTNGAHTSAPFPEARNLEMTPDGRFIVFVANTNTLKLAATCIQMWDAQSGRCALVSVGSGWPALPGSMCDWPTVDPSGRFVAFLSSATNQVTNHLAGEYHLYRRDLQTATTELVDVDAAGAGSPIDPTAVPRLSADGRYVAFESRDADLVPDDRNRATDVFVRDFGSGGTELVSQRQSALAGRTPNGLSSMSPGGVSADGRYIAFVSQANNLAGLDTNECRDVFVRDLASATNLLVSVNTNGVSGDGPAGEPWISADGRYVAFTSVADDLAAGDTNRASDVFVRDLVTETTMLVSVHAGGTGSGSRASYAPRISADGRSVLFRSQATNLATGAFSGAENLFVRDLQQERTYALTSTGMLAAAMAPDGRFVAVVTSRGTSSGACSVWERESAAMVYTGPSVVGLTNVALSPDGRRLAYWAGSSTLQLYGLNWAGSGGATLLSAAGPPARQELCFSRDGGRLAYTRRVGTTNQVWLYDFQTGANRLVSRVFFSASLAAPGFSDSLALSGDGRFVAYRSSATNLVVGYTNGLPGIFLYDAQAGTNTWLTVSPSGEDRPDNRSLSPVFSADGQTLVFQSWMPGLVSLDSNHSTDLFVYTLLYVSVLTDASGSPWLTWPAIPGKSYRVLGKNDLTEAGWREIGGSTTNVGTKVYLADPAPPPGRRFYRVIAY